MILYRPCWASYLSANLQLIIWQQVIFREIRWSELIGNYLFRPLDGLNKILYLAVRAGVGIEQGYFWNVLTIHMEDENRLCFGGVSKKKNRFITNQNESFIPYITSEMFSQAFKREEHKSMPRPV